MISPYVGGGFGSQGSLTQRTAMVARAAQQLRQPMRVETTGDQRFTIATYRAETRHRVRLDANADGKLQARIFESWEVSSRPDNYKVGGTDATTQLYACPNVDSEVTVVHADHNTPDIMHSPPEVPRLFAIESAMDELSVEVGDSALSPAPVAGGSNSTAGIATVVAQAYEQVLGRIAGAAVAAEDSVLHSMDPAGLVLVDGTLRASDGASEPLEAAMSRTADGAIKAYAENILHGVPSGALKRLYQGQGTLMDSQIWGASAALHQATEIDRRAARYTNNESTEHLIPVHADMQEVTTILLPEQDTEVNKLGDVGINAAAANAVFPATGIRELPVRIEKLLETSIVST